VFLSTSAFQLNYDAERNPDVNFSDVKDYQRKQG
jgi:peptide chain release factor 3